MQEGDEDKSSTEVVFCYARTQGEQGRERKIGLTSSGLFVDITVNHTVKKHQQHNTGEVR